MKQAENLSTDRFAREVMSLEQIRFTGKLEVQSAVGKEWKLYYGLGKLIWAESTEHPYHSWKRHLVRYCPQISWKETDIAEAEKFECWNYYLLTKLLQRQIIVKEQLKALVTCKIGEVLFDIFQQEAFDPLLNINSKPEPGDFLLSSGLKISLALFEVRPILTQTRQDWLTWCQHGLELISPNLAPRLKNSEQLKSTLPPLVYQNFVKLIDGRRTLRELALLMNSELLKLTCSLVPYIAKGAMELREVSDIPRFTTLETKFLNPSGNGNPLIACVDDSLQICRVMEHLLENEGYKFLGIQNSLQALPVLIASEPDLIFLDIAMPIANGYEICSQLRRVSKFKHTPIIMLTGHDGIIDRVRAKVSGASGFMAKPIEVSKIIDAARSFLTKEKGGTERTSISQSDEQLASIGLGENLV